MQRAIAKQAEAERERRAKIIHAEGEFEAPETCRRRQSSRDPASAISSVFADFDEIVREETTIVFRSIDIINQWTKN